MWIKVKAELSPQKSDVGASSGPANGVFRQICEAAQQSRY
jgi:hypothetical protein